MFKKVTIILVALVAIMAVSCSAFKDDPTTYTIKYYVGGTSENIDVTYRDRAGSMVVQSLTNLPANYIIEEYTSGTAYLETTIKDTGSATLRIYFDSDIVAKDYYKSTGTRSISYTIK